MRLQDCVLDIDLFVAAPFVRDQPEKRWLDARDSAAIPPELFELYQAAGFLSFRAGSRFLTDERNVLFSYFSLILNCLADGLVDAAAELTGFSEDQNLTYDYGKKIRGERWDPEADTRAKRHFRDFLIALDASLDTLADITAVFLTGRIERLRLGRGDFSKIERWIALPLKPNGIVATPYEFHLERLYNALKPLILPAAPEEEWLDLMHTLRNKIIHLGHATLRQIGLYDKATKAYIFLPRKWPFIWETDFKVHDAKTGRPHAPTMLASLLIDQDIITFADFLHKRVMGVVRTTISEILSMYRDFENFETNFAAIAELDQSAVIFKFERFLET